MDVTEHAKDRINERVGLPKKAAEKHAMTALEKGLSRAECTGRLGRYIDYVFLKHHRGANIRIWSGYVYVFTRKDLVTVLPLPREHRATATKMLKKKQS
jgi:hypothetical protein